ncbi:aminoacylase-1-like isoform X1 [Abrus precatorius]|uniref:N-acyl-aliphatic-L-amino acid amidohydrolase n=1 Tax=Abrus precatorius TaxID=3816 RepID=A0A8B8LZM0_ABRPR|nr:aminoacylase-1-like isoform X1 [Abrus precatorius]
MVSNCRIIILLLLSLALTSELGVESSSSIEEEESSIISRFQRYLKINTAQPNPRYKEATDFLLSEGKALSLESQIIELAEGKPLVLLKWEGRNPHLSSILLYSHTDVVPSEHDKWTHHPFSAHIDSHGRIYARGSQDMKCVGMQYLEAIRRLKALHFHPLRTVYVAFSPDEEIGGHDGAEKFVQSQIFQQMNVGIVLDEGLASPDDHYRVFYAERSPLWLVIKAVGAPGHGSKLYDNSAMENLLKSIESIRRFRTSQLDLIKAGLKAEGDVISVNMAFLKAGTPSPTGFVMNLQPSEAEAGFDIRVPPTSDLESLERRIAQEWAPSSRNMSFSLGQFIQKVPVRGKSGEPILTKTDGSNPWWTLLENAVKKAGGKHGKPEVFPASTDSHFFRSRGLPAIGFSPMANTPVLLHDHDEFLNKDVYLKGIEIYESIIKEYASFDDHGRDGGSRDEL